MWARMVYFVCTVMLPVYFLSYLNLCMRVRHFFHSFGIGLIFVYVFQFIIFTCLLCLFLFLISNEWKNCNGCWNSQVWLHSSFQIFFLHISGFSNPTHVIWTRFESKPPMSNFHPIVNIVSEGKVCDIAMLCRMLRLVQIVRRTTN